MRALGMISRSFSGRGRSALRLLYLSLVRSLLVYGTPAWHPTTKGNLAKMEQVQSKATYTILKSKKSPTETRTQRLEQCKLPNLPELLERVDLRFLSRCLQGSCAFSLFGPNRASVRRRRDGLRGGEGLLEHPRGQNSAYLTSLIPRCVRAFNALPEADRSKLLAL